MSYSPVAEKTVKVLIADDEWNMRTTLAIKKINPTAVAIMIIGQRVSGAIKKPPPDVS